MTIPSREICHLSDAKSGSIASYYRCAVARYRGDVARIEDAINLIPPHLGANNENASESHRLCPFEENYWCRYQLANWQNITTPYYPKYLNEQSTHVYFPLGFSLLFDPICCDYFFIFENVCPPDYSRSSQTGAPPKPGRSPDRHLTYTMVFSHV